MFSKGDELYDPRFGERFDVLSGTPGLTVEHPTPLPRTLERALVATLAAAGTLFGPRIPPASTTSADTADNSEIAADES